MYYKKFNYAWVNDELEIVQRQLQQPVFQPDGGQAVADDDVQGGELVAEHELGVAELLRQDRAGNFSEGFSVLEETESLAFKIVQDYFFAQKSNVKNICLFAQKFYRQFLGVKWK